MPEELESLFKFIEVERSPRATSDFIPQPPRAEPKVSLKINRGQSPLHDLKHDDPAFPILIGKRSPGVDVTVVDVKQRQILARLLKVLRINFVIFVFLNYFAETSAGEDVVSHEAKLFHDTVKRPQSSGSGQSFEIYRGQDRFNNPRAEQALVFAFAAVPQMAAVAAPKIFPCPEEA